jgi:hypothetical protein
MRIKKRWNTFGKAFGFCGFNSQVQVHFPVPDKVLSKSSNAEPLAVASGCDAQP